MIHADEHLLDGPSIMRGGRWQGPDCQPGAWTVQEVLDLDGVLYARMVQRSPLTGDQQLALIAVVTLLRDWDCEDQHPPTTCKQCGLTAHLSERSLRQAGWWPYGMGSGPLCPAHHEQEQA